MWYSLIEAVTDYFTGCDELQDCAILIGADAAIPTQQTIVLKRGPAELLNFGEPWRGTQTIYIECWEHDPDDFAAAYERLETLETAVLALIRKIPNNLLDEVVVNARVSAVEPDNDVFRPSVGSQITLLLDYRRSVTSLRTL